MAKVKEPVHVWIRKVSKILFVISGLASDRCINLKYALLCPGLLLCFLDIQQQIPPREGLAAGPAFCHWNEVPLSGYTCEFCSRQFIAGNNYHPSVIVKVTQELGWEKDWLNNAISPPLGDIRSSKLLRMAGVYQARNMRRILHYIKSDRFAVQPHSASPTYSQARKYGMDRRAMAIRAQRLAWIKFARSSEESSG